MADPYVNVCPYCHAFLVSDVYLGPQGALFPADPPLAASLCYTVCRKCGSVVRAYVTRSEQEQTP